MNKLLLSSCLVFRVIVLVVKHLFPTSTVGVGVFAYENLMKFHVKFVLKVIVEIDSHVV